MLSAAARGSAAYLYEHGDGPEKLTTDYYTAAEGEPAGRWFGAGAEALGLNGVATVEQMRTVYDELRHPETGEALGQRPGKYHDLEARVQAALARETDPTPEREAELRVELRPANREARHYWDLTMSMPKSYSVLHAAYLSAGDFDRADAIWTEWEAAADQAFEWMMTKIPVTRKSSGMKLPNGQRATHYVEGNQWVMSKWAHHTSRDGDPNLHIHYAVLNRVQCADGTWRALDGTAILAMKRAAGALAERLAEERLTDRLGVRFVWDGEAREIAGIPRSIRDVFSSRSRGLSTQAKAWIKEYRDTYGHEPSAYTKWAINQQATLTTRRKKGEPLPEVQRIEQWGSKLQATLQQSFAEVIRAVSDEAARAPVHEGPFNAQTAITLAIAEVSSKRSSWGRWDLMFELRKHLPSANVGDPEAFLDQLTDQALTDPEVVRLSAPDLVAVPAELIRSDGYSVFQRSHGEVYASRTQLMLEGKLERGSVEGGAPALSRQAAVERVQATSATPQQAEVLTELLSSDRWVQTVVGVAGGGKSWVIGQLSELWEEATGNETYGVTLSLNAAHVLSSEGLGKTASITRFIGTHEFLGKKTAEEIDAHPALRKMRDKYVVQQGQIVVIDEASQVATPEMVRVAQIVRAAGAKLIVVGDDRQTTAVGHGGGFNLLLENSTPLVLDEVRRMSAEWERAASVRFRDADLSVLPEYERYGRLIGGPKNRMMANAVEAFTADTIRQRSAVIVVDSNEAAAEVNSHVRARFVELGLVGEQSVKLRDATHAGVGDVIVLRETIAKRDLTNRDQYLVTGVDDAGQLKVRKLLGRDDMDVQRYEAERVLDSDYVASHVTLGYAQTKDSVQGRTVDSSYQLVTDSTDWRSLYVGMSRGRFLNKAFIATGKDQHHHDVLVEIAQRNREDLAATQVQRREWETADHLATHGHRLDVLVDEQIGQRYGQAFEIVVGAKLAKRINEDQAVPSLNRLLRSAELDGHDVPDLIARAVAEREVESADSVAKVIHHRIERQLAKTVTRETPREFVPRSFTEGLGPRTDDNVSRYAHQLADAMDQRAQELGRRAAEVQPEHLARLGTVPDEALARWEWEQRAAAVEAYRERWNYDKADAIGPCPKRGAAQRRADWIQAYTALGSPAEQRPMTERSDAELRSLIATHDRQREFEPANHDEAMAKAHRAVETWSNKATVQRAELEGMDRASDDAAELVTKIERAERLAAEARERAEQYADGAGARNEWLELTKDDRDAAQLAKAELEMRYPSVAAQDQAEREAARNEPVPFEATTSLDEAKARIEQLRRTTERDQRRERERIEQTPDRSPDRQIERY